jgi:hypothetical protein
MCVCAAYSAHHLRSEGSSTVSRRSKRVLCNVLNVVFHAQPGLTHALLAEPKRLSLLVGIAVEGVRRSANGKNAIKPDSFLA